MTDRTDSKDELIDKLDHLISRGRASAGTQGAAVPVLTEALPDVTGEPIPTLTEAVAGPGQGPARRLGQNELERLVAMRLAECIEREVSRLGGEFPTQREALGSLRTAVVRSLPGLVRSALSDAADSAANTRPGAPADEADRD